MDFASVVSIAGGGFLLCKLDVTQKKQLERISGNMKTSGLGHV